MRWIFLSLLVVNLAVFVWSWMNDDLSSKPSQVQSSFFAYQGLPELEIIKFDQLATAGSTAVPEERVPPLGSMGQSVSEGKPLCEMVGVFESLASAKAFSDRLVAIDIAHGVNELDVSGGDRFWVYLTADGGKEKVLERLAGLQAQGIDSYYIPRGELADTISLGVYSREQLALARVEAMEAKGLSPKIKIKQQSYREIWVVLSPGEHKKMSNLTWTRVLGENNSLERRQNFCLDVAS